MPATCCYVLTLKPLPSEVPSSIRLRQALKVLVRAFKLRAVDVRQISSVSEVDKSKEKELTVIDP